MAPKKGLILQRPKSSKNATLPYENLIFVVPRPSKIVPKSMPKCLLNRLRLGYPLANPKNTIFEHKKPPRWSPEISDFFKNRLKIVDDTAFCARCLLKASKSLSRAVPEPSRTLQNLQEPPFRLPRNLREAGLQSFLHSWTEEHTSTTKAQCYPHVHTIAVYESDYNADLAALFQ